MLEHFILKGGAKPQSWPELYAAAEAATTRLAVQAAQAEADHDTGGSNRHIRQIMLEALERQHAAASGALTLAEQTRLGALAALIEKREGSFAKADDVLERIAEAVPAGIILQRFIVAAQTDTAARQLPPSDLTKIMLADADRQFDVAVRGWRVHELYSRAQGQVFPRADTVVAVLQTQIKPFCATTERSLAEKFCPG